MGVNVIFFKMTLLSIIYHLSGHFLSIKISDPQQMKASLSVPLLQLEEVKVCLNLEQKSRNFFFLFIA